FKEAGKEARLPINQKPREPFASPPIDKLWAIPIVAYGESISWTRPVARFIQRSAKETSILFIILGLATVFFMGLRRGLYVLMVPLYYFVFQSVLHTEFRYTLPLHHYMFVFSAVIWVLIFSVALNGARRVIERNRKAKEEPATVA
ncbi:MAG TPA: hypothetical protein VJX74_01150, partial [Blastocatellia bacterium]|nr:hypothetical protein [Blastocatellia bacterium]